MLNFKITLPLAKLDMVGSRLVTNGFIVSDDVLVDTYLIIFLLLFNISELTIGAKTKKFWEPSSPVNYILTNKNLYPFSDIY